MFWVGLELIRERGEPEVIVFAGDQRSGYDGADPEGVALLFSREPAPYAPLGRALRLLGLERSRSSSRRPTVVANAAAGARAMLAVLRDQPPGRFTYAVPAAHGDGIDELVVTWELG
jgi:hypothetical protein